MGPSFDTFAIQTNGDMELNDLALEVVSIAKKAGAAIMDVYDNYADIGVQQKSDDSPLTLADQEANDVIMAGLQKLSIQYPIVSEENKAIPYHVRKAYDRLWIVDPLDGTKEFIKRNGEFTVNIALIEGGRSILGVIYAPAMDLTYWAAKGVGSFKEVSGQYERITAASFTTDQTQVKVVCSRSHLNDATQACVDVFDQPELVPTGSSLKIALLAEGVAHFYPRMGPTMEWDIAAAQIILEEANGTLIRVDDKSNLAYNREDMLNPSFLAFGQTDVSALLEKLAL